MVNPNEKYNKSEDESDDKVTEPKYVVEWRAKFSFVFSLGVGAGSCHDEENICAKVPNFKVTKMGCNSSSVVPLGETDIIDGAGIKVRVNPSTPDTIKLSPNPEVKSCLPKKFSTPPLESSEPPVETLTKDFNTIENHRVPPPPPPPPMAFEVPVNEDSLIKKHPPKRFRRLEEQQTESSKLTHEWIDIKQQEAETRRKEILSQRIQSAQQKNSHNRRLIHSDAFSQESEDQPE